MGDFLSSPWVELILTHNTQPKAIDTLKDVPRARWDVSTKMWITNARENCFHFVPRWIPVRPRMLPESTNFMSLPDLVLLECLSYLSCEDALCTIGSLHSDRLNHLLVERGAFRQICLSPTLSARRYEWLLDGVWSLQSVESLVLHGVFAEFFIPLSLLKNPLPSLTDLRLIDIDYPHHSIEQFILSHSLTLTHLTVTSKFHSFNPSPISGLLSKILPQLRRLIRLDTGSNNNIYVSIGNSSKVVLIITNDLYPPESNSNDQIYEICCVRIVCPSLRSDALRHSVEISIWKIHRSR